MSTTSIGSLRRREASFRVTVTDQMENFQPDAQNLTAESQLLFNRLGGEHTITLIEMLLYDKAQSDERISFLFSGINMHQLWCLQKVFFIMILGGPQDYSGPCLIQIRKMLVINNNNKFAEGHFEIFMTHLRSTLCLLNVKTDEQREVMERVAKWKSFV